MNKVVKVLLVAAILLPSSATLAASLWQPVERDLVARGVQHPAAYFSVDFNALEQRLRTMPDQVLQDFSNEIELPMPDGSLARFSIVEAPIMQPELAQKYPQIKTYKVFGIDDPVASGRVDISPRGFFGMLHTSGGRVFIDPVNILDTSSLYMARHQNSIPRTQDYSGGVNEPDFIAPSNPATPQRIAERVPGMLLQYVLAVAATEEYVVAVGPPNDVANAQMAIVTAINAVNQVYERDLGITLALVGGNDNLIENGSNVSFSNFDSLALLTENQAWIDSEIGDPSYDIGHVFGTGNGGVARISSVCLSNDKAMGVSGLPNPTGDPFYIDFVAHEIGHQFGANHTFNGTTGSCFGNRSASTAVEPGSGSTIMGYAGICLGENLQINSDATFHANTIAEIDAFTGSVFCDTPVATSPAGNSEPVIAPIADVSIPSNTAFMLTGTASDPDIPPDTLTYQWDQMDTGAATNNSSFGTDQVTNPLFRTYEPRATALRHFPALGTQVLGQFDKAEAMACKQRQLNFRLTARDGRSGQDIEDVRIDVTDAGPFEISNFNTAQTIVSSNGAITLRWNVAGTAGAPVSCPDVDIDLLTFAPGHLTYTAHSLLTATTNDGQQSVSIMPLTDSHTQARFRVSCSNSIFYDISDADLVITGTVVPQTPFDQDDTVTVFNTVGITVGSVAPSCVNVNAGGGNSSGSGKRDSGAFDLIWLLLLTGMAGARYWLRRQG